MRGDDGRRASSSAAVTFFLTSTSTSTTKNEFFFQMPQIIRNARTQSAEALSPFFLAEWLMVRERERK